MGNFYKDKERAQNWLTRYVGSLSTGQDLDAIYLEFRANTFLLCGKPTVEEILSVLVRRGKIEYDGYDYYPPLPKLSKEAALETFDAEIQSLGLKEETE